MFTKTFNEVGTFKALGAAHAWLEQNGYSCGSTCRGSPSGVLKGRFAIAKWRNLTALEIKQLDGRLTGNYREGPLVLTLNEDPAA